MLVAAMFISLSLEACKANLPCNVAATFALSLIFDSASEFVSNMFCHFCDRRVADTSYAMGGRVGACETHWLMSVFWPDCTLGQTPHF